MSLWTPGGEHGEQGEQGEPGRPRSAEDLSEEDREKLEEIATQVAEVRRQLRETPAEVIVANHAMGLYELAAVHLSADPPDLAQARLAIDAMGGIVDPLEGRLGEHEEVLRDALAQIRLAFVQIQAAHGQGQGPTEAS